MVPKLSVIIPTHKRAAILRECLRHLENQTIADQIEVIVVSDGPDEETRNIFQNAHFKIPVSFFEIPKSQQGAARNEGVKHARGEYVMFIGDDIFLENDACEKHLKSYESDQRSAVSGQLAVLGFTTWDPAVGITDVMKWLETSGWQFGYPMISAYAHAFVPEDLQHKFTYTSHISLPLTAAQKHPFRTDVHLYGWEDIEWGMRLKDSGVRLFYEPDAASLHHHRITMEESLKRMEILGRSAKEIKEKIPDFDLMPRGWKLFAYKILSMFPTMAGKHRKAFLSELAD